MLREQVNALHIKIRPAYTPRMCVYLMEESAVSTVPSSAKALAAVDAARGLFLRHGIRRVTGEEI